MEPKVLILVKVALSWVLTMVLPNFTKSWLKLKSGNSKAERENIMAINC